MAVLDGIQQGGRRHGLEQISTGAQGPDALAVARLIMAGDDDHRRMYRPVAKRLEHVKAIQARHVQIHDDAVKFLLLFSGEQRLSLLKECHIKALAPQQTAQGGQHLGLVVQQGDDGWGA